MEKKIIILLGKSGSGKGTQAELLAKKFGLYHLVSGDLLRNRAKKPDFTGKKLAKVLSHGELAPMAVIFKLWLDKAEILKNDKKTKGFIMDGNPRRISEVYLDDEVFGWYEWLNVKAVLIDIYDKEAKKRLGKRRVCQNKKCGKVIPFIGEYKTMKKCPNCGGKLVFREDDTPESIKNRLAWFKTEVQPIIDYYKKTRRLLKVNGEGTIEEVFSRILKALK